MKSFVFGKILEINVYRHMINFAWFDHLYSSFAWWAYGDDFCLFSVGLFEFLDDSILIFKFQVGKTNFCLEYYQ